MRAVTAMARQSNAEYWAQRLKNMEDALKDQVYSDYVQNLDEQFAAADSEIRRQMESWYQRLAANNDITLADAKKLLNADELEEFHWTVEQYIKYGEENALDQKWVKQLENASAKVHVSRLEALQVQIRQQAEKLHTAVEKAAEGAAKGIYESSYYRTAYEVQKELGIGWALQELNEGLIEKILSRPWTADGQTFRDHCWTNKASLIDSVNKNLTQMLIRGDSPDKAITAITKEFGVSKRKAGRLVMTESAYFSSTAQQDCFSELGVEKYKIVAALDHATCPLCGAMDGKVLKMSDYKVGMTAPPFHPWCRCCTCPYYDDMESLGERYARDAVTGERYKVPGNMTYEQWKAQQDALHGEGTVDLQRKMGYNINADKAQLARYQKLLGRKDNLRSIEKFQNLKYCDADGYAALKISYADKRLQKRLTDDPAYTVLKTGAQGKHILGHNNYKPGRSYLTVSMDEAQELVRKYAGKGEIKRDSSGKWTHKEFVTADRVIGYIVPLDGGEPYSTKRFSISYAVGKDKGAHIVPAKEVNP